MVAGVAIPEQVTKATFGTDSFERTAILVLGMHRSGTSAVTRVLSLLGATLPERLMPKAEGNPVGYFEPMEIVSIHERLLASADTEWSDWGAFPQEWYRSASREAFLAELTEAVTRNYGDDGLFLVKDPRLLRFVPLWRDLLTDARVRPAAVLPFRNPIEVALSLKRRDGFPQEHGFLLWLRHVLDAEFHSRDLVRAFVSYDRLLEQKRMATYGLIESLPFDWPRKTSAAFDEIAQFLDGKLRRNTASRDDLALLAGIPDPVRTTFRAYERLERDPYDRAAMAELDAVRTEFDCTTGIMADTFKALRRQFEADQSEAIAMRSEVATYEKRLEARAQDLMEHAAALKQQRTEIGVLYTELQHRLADVDNLHGTLHAMQVEAARQNESIDNLHGTLHAMQVEAARQNEAIRAVADERYGLLQAEIGSLNGATHALKVEAAHHRNEIRAASGALDRSIGGLQEDLLRLRGAAAYADHYRAQERRHRWWRRVKPDPERAALCALILRSGLFDPEWYRARYLAEGPDVDPIDHYVDHGRARRLNPGPNFDAEWYAEANPDVAASGHDLFLHYLQHGREEGRPPLRR